MMLKKFNNFILEKVYLFKTMFDSYDMIIDKYSKTGFIKVEIEGVEYKIEIESYGKLSDNLFIFRNPSEIAILDNSLDIFTQIMNDVLYILNKNQLDYKFILEYVGKERGMTYEYALIKCIHPKEDSNCTIEDLERVSLTTKIMTKKIKDVGNLDKLIYQTKETKENK